MLALKFTLQRGIGVLIAGLGVAALLAGGSIAAAPPANAGCVYGGFGIISKCDGPVQPDGTWQRCVGFMNLIQRGASSYFAPDKQCDVLGPGFQPAGAFADPPDHIDD